VPRRTTSYDGHQNRLATWPELIAAGGALGRGCTDDIGLGPRSESGLPNRAFTRCSALSVSVRLARAWVRVIWRCWTDHTPYNPATHTGALRVATAA
jgi:hypothetical protein